MASKMKFSVITLRPCDDILKKSLRFRSRSITGTLINYAERRLRPLARRAFNTLRPPTVSMRERKPWRRLRTRRLG